MTCSLARREDGSSFAPGASGGDRGRFRPSCSYTTPSAPSNCGAISPVDWRRRLAILLWPDRLGFGRSDPHRGVLETPGFIRDEARVSLPAICSGLSIDGVILFGHSVGGAMAIVAAAEMATITVGVITESAQVFAEERTLSAIRAAKEVFADPEQLERIERYHGSKSRWVPTNADVVLFDDCGHVPHRERVDAVLEAVGTFIKTHVRE